MNKPKLVVIFILLCFASVYFLPQAIKQPVWLATKNSYNPKSFWYYPWGKSVVHKGVDIFAKKGTPIFSSTKGIVIFKGNLALGGNVVLLLAPKWQLHYFAHLQQIKVNYFDFVSHKTIIGHLGDTGNAKGKPPHLHFSIMTLIPKLSNIDDGPQGFKKMFYLNPIDYF